MSDKQKQKILDVMHTLARMRDGKVHYPQASAKACWEVLNKVLEMEEQP